MCTGKWEKWLSKMEDEQEWTIAGDPPPITCLAHLEKAAKGAAAKFRHVAQTIGKKEKWRPFQTQKYSEPIWFRGDAHWPDNYKLHPTVYRKRSLPPEDRNAQHPRQGLRTPEKFMLSRFRMEAVSRHADTPGYDEEARWLCLAQHYTLPTRLLDWSESILNAAWFGVVDQKEDEWREYLSQLWEHASGEVGERFCQEQRQKFESNLKTMHSNPAIWALSPALLNYHYVKDGPVFMLEGPHAGVMVSSAFNGMSIWDTIWATVPQRLRQRMFEFYRSNSEGDVEDKVLAVKASQVDARMMQQQACFTIHAARKPEEHDLSRETPKYYDDEDGALNQGAGATQLPEFLLKFSVPRDKRSSIRDELQRAGVHNSTLFPDLQTLAEETAAEWKAKCATERDRISRSLLSQSTD